MWPFTVSQHSRLRLPFHFRALLRVSAHPFISLSPFWLTFFAWQILTPFSRVNSLPAVASRLCPMQHLQGRLLPGSTPAAPEAVALALPREGKLSFLYCLFENLLFISLGFRWSTGLTFLQWFLCPAELKIIQKHQWMDLFPAFLPFAGNLSYPYWAHSQYTTVCTLFWCPLHLQSVSTLSGLLSPLVSHKECFLSLFCSWGCALLFSPSKKSLYCLAHHSPS